MADENERPKRGKLPPLVSPSETSSTKTLESRGRKKKTNPGSVGDDEASSTRSRPSSSSRTRSATSSSRKDSFKSTPTPTQSETPRERKLVKKKPTISANDPHASSGGETDRTTRKKRKSQGRTLSKEVLLSNEHSNGHVTTTGSDTTGGTQKKKRKRKRPGPTETSEDTAIGLEADLQDLDDDDVLVTDTSISVDEPKWMAPNMRSEPANKVFIEQKSGFKSADKMRLARQREEQQLRAMEANEDVSVKTTIQYALSTHRVFKVFSVFLNGLFAGMTLWQIIVTFMLLAKTDEAFLENYYELAQPVQSTYYFLFGICTVAAFDRYDVGRPNQRFVVRAFTLQSGAISCLFYLLGLIFSVAIAAEDDRIGLYKTDPTLWEDPDDTSSRLNTWKILNLVRGLFAILAWIVISLRPTTDRLRTNLENAEENILDPVSEVREIEVIRSGAV